MGVEYLLLSLYTNPHNKLCCLFNYGVTDAITNVNRKTLLAGTVTD